MTDKQLERFNHAMEVCEGMLDLSRIPAPREREGWTPVELDILVDWIYEKGVQDWRGCAAAVGTKSAKQCQDKYRNMRARTIKRTCRRNDETTNNENGLVDPIRARDD